MSEKDKQFDLSSNQAFGKQKVAFANNDDLKLTFTGDIEDQVVIAESGNNVVVTAYAQEQTQWQKVSVITSEEKISSGKNKGKYTQTIAVSNYDETAGDWGEAVITTKYVKTKGDGTETITYQEVGKTSGTIYQTEDEEDETEGHYDSETVVNKSSTLGTVTYTNGKKATDISLSLTSDIYGENFDVLDYSDFEPAYSKKKKTYTGTYLNETVDATGANEIFKLAGGTNTINFDMTKKVGKNTVYIDKNSKTVLNFSGLDSSYNTYAKKSGNNVIIYADKKVGTEYIYKAMIDVAKKPNSEGLYSMYVKYYALNDEGTGYKTTPESGEAQLISKAAIPSLGLKAGKTTTLYCKSANYTDDATKKAPVFIESYGSATLKNYLSNAVDNVYTDDGSYSFKTPIENMIGIQGNADSKKKQNIKGSWLNETITAGLGNDKITTGAGNDEISTSAGTDKITINGQGLKTIDIAGLKGKTTIDFAKGLQFKDSNNDYYVALDIVDSTANPEDRVYYEYMKSGNDLIFTTNAQEELYKIAFGTKYVADKNRLVIKDFFKNDDISQVTEIYGYKFDDGLYQFGKANKKNTLKDTKYDDFIAGGNKADKITLSGDGEDFIVTLKGNDKITITKDAIDDKIIMFIPGDGNDTVSVERDSEANVRLENYGVLFEKGDEEAKAAVSYEKTGDNLIIKSDFKKGAYRIGEDDENITLKKDTTDTVTVTDYFRNNADFKFLYTYWSTEDGGHWDDRAGDLGEVLNANQNSKYLKINSVYDKHEKLYVYEGTEFKDEYTYAGKNASIMLDLIEGKKSDDKYNLTLTSKSNLEIDDNGGHDVLNINDEIENLRFFFDVQKGATVEDSTFGNSLYIFKNGSLTAKNVMNARDYKTSGSVKIDDYFTRIADEGDTFTVNALQGHTGEYTAEIYELADSIRAQVATWLLSDANTGNFDSALSVFKDGDKDSIATLVGYYNQAIDPSV